jgi:hypothetical protein
MKIGRKQEEKMWQTGAEEMVDLKFHVNFLIFHFSMLHGSYLLALVILTIFLQMFGNHSH